MAENAKHNYDESKIKTLSSQGHIRHSKLAKALDSSLRLAAGSKNNAIVR